MGQPLFLFTQNLEERIAPPKPFLLLYGARQWVLRRASVVFDPGGRSRPTGMARALRGFPHIGVSR